MAHSQRRMAARPHTLTTQVTFQCAAAPLPCFRAPLGTQLHLLCCPAAVFCALAARHQAPTGLGHRHLGLVHPVVPRVGLFQPTVQRRQAAEQSSARAAALVPAGQQAYNPALLQLANSLLDGEPAHMQINGRSSCTTTINKIVVAGLQRLPAHDPQQAEQAAAARAQWISSSVSTDKYPAAKVVYADGSILDFKTTDVIITSVDSSVTTPEDLACIVVAMRCVARVPEHATVVLAGMCALLQQLQQQHATMSLCSLALSHAGLVGRTGCASFYCAEHNAP
ncbi:hypothetical protein COO60DRAFT_1619280, partial [Scenedesmus sp. NREL 46B-D3]